MPSSFGRLHYFCAKLPKTERQINFGGFILLFIFTFKVGKSYENSVNHGGNTSYQSNDKISCHSQASFNLVIQLSLVEFGRRRLKLRHFQ